MERLLRDPAALSLDGRIGLHRALYKSHADAGRYDDAFSHLRQANRVRRAVVKYDEAAWKKRSQASHPAVHGAGELPYLGETVERFAKSGPSAAGYPECLIGAEPEAFAGLGAAYADRLRRLAPAALRIVDKMPINYLHVGLIHLILRAAKIIHVRRDAMDTCFSCFENDFDGRQSYSYDLGELGRCYADYREMMAHWRQILPAGRMLEVTYEEVVSDFEAQARRLVQYCELPWDDRCLRFHETERAVFTQSQAQVRRPLYSSSIGRWKPYASHLEALAVALEQDPISLNHTDR